MTKLLGANWATTLWGWITIVAVAIAARPDIIAFLPDSWEPYISGIAGLIAIITAGAFAQQVKSKNVTGGTVPQTADGSVSAIPSTAVIETVKAPEKK